MAMPCWPREPSAWPDRDRLGHSGRRHRGATAAAGARDYDRIYREFLALYRDSAATVHALADLQPLFPDEI